MQDYEYDNNRSLEFILNPEDVWKEIEIALLRLKPEVKEIKRVNEGGEEEVIEVRTGRFIRDENAKPLVSEVGLYNLRSLFFALVNKNTITTEINDMEMRLRLKQIQQRFITSLSENYKEWLYPEKVIIEKEYLILNEEGNNYETDIYFSPENLVKKKYKKKKFLFFEIKKEDEEKQKDIKTNFKIPVMKKRVIKKQITENKYNVEDIKTIITIMIENIENAFLRARDGLTVDWLKTTQKITEVSTVKEELVDNQKKKKFFNFG